jgi:hypothetical protein
MDNLSWPVFYPLSLGQIVRFVGKLEQSFCGKCYIKLIVVCIRNQNSLMPTYVGNFIGSAIQQFSSPPPPSTAPPLSTTPQLYSTTDADPKSFHNFSGEPY